ncbi:FecR family protein [Maribacter stanieri]|uniref:FecR family protein n=1 Tax=Maribacter stanieri TaxID=440514 RepID=UPI002494A37B|nr:FecR domain-containing protein [Maribacter stanieri]|tara:strand:- start:8263 stop:9426 length:1164 start_codon:yes stop_codon:yes gene_type:complete
MVSKDIEILIIKYFSQSANVEDLDQLNTWLYEEKNQVFFKEYVKIHFSINLAMNDPKLDKVRDELLKEIRNEKRTINRIKFLSVLKYAAIAIVFLGLGFLTKNYILGTNQIEKVIPREDDITLELGNGEKQIIREDGSKEIVDVQGNIIGDKKGAQLVYEVDNNNNMPKLNTLSIPKGKRFEVVLSDGTKVHLNSGSSITYPTSFVSNMPRKVTLQGEAYFEVSHEEQRQFIVSVQNLDVKVYGTKFNVNNYLEDIEAEIVLVDGSVSLSVNENLSYKESEVFLEPGYMGVFNKQDKKIINQIVNTELYTSWMQGNLVFRNEPFENIIQKLERHYNVIIINNNAQLADEKFNATIEVDYETIEQVFKYFNKVYQIEYQIVENKIIIN